MFEHTGLGRHAKHCVEFASISNHESDQVREVVWKAKLTLNFSPYLPILRKFMSINLDKLEAQLLTSLDSPKVQEAMDTLAKGLDTYAKDKHPTTGEDAAEITTGQRTDWRVTIIEGKRAKAVVPEAGALIA